MLVFGAGQISKNLHEQLEPFVASVTLVGRTARAGVVDVKRGRAELGDQDVVILQLPLDDSTVHLLDAVFLATMKDGAVLVNAARGELVDAEGYSRQPVKR